MRSLFLLGMILMGDSALANNCFVLSSSPDRWDHTAEKLCIDEVSLLVDPGLPESPTNPRITKTRIKLFAARPLDRHHVAIYILDMLPSGPGATTFGVSVPSNSIFSDLTISFEDIHGSDQRHLRGRVRIGNSEYYYRSITHPE